MLVVDDLVDDRPVAPSAGDGFGEWNYRSVATSRVDLLSSILFSCFFSENLNWSINGLGHVRGLTSEDKK